MLYLTIPSARALLLAAQGLHELSAIPAARPDVLAAIRRMGALQIDSIHVVARSPYLVLWSRLGAYQPAWLDQLLAEGALFEYWAHAACFLPIENFALYRGRMLKARNEGRWRDWMDVNAAVVAQVLARSREHGPLRSADFARAGRGGPWWDWKPEKAALELLFDQGYLMIARREHFQRVYDLHERVLPGWDDSSLPGPEAVRERQILDAVRALGLAPAHWVADYFRLSKQGLAAQLARLADAGALQLARVAGWDTPVYLHPANQALAEAAAASALTPTRTTLLSPFDPVVWDRARARELFGFDYRIEVYTPAARRVYGYFTLPILHQGQLVGRLDPKAHRTEGRFEVRGLHLEPGVVLNEALLDGLAAALSACAVWHATPEVTISRSEPPALAEALRARLGAGA